MCYGPIRDVCDCDCLHTAHRHIANWRCKRVVVGCLEIAASHLDQPWQQRTPIQKVCHLAGLGRPPVLECSKLRLSFVCSARDRHYYLATAKTSNSEFRPLQTASKRRCQKIRGNFRRSQAQFFGQIFDDAECQKSEVICKTRNPDF